MTIFAISRTSGGERDMPSGARKIAYDRRYPEFSSDFRPAEDWIIELKDLAELLDMIRLSGVEGIVSHLPWEGAEVRNLKGADKLPEYSIEIYDDYRE